MDMKKINIRTVKKAIRGVNGAQAYKTSNGYGIGFTGFSSSEERKHRVINESKTKLADYGLEFKQEYTFGLFVPAEQN